MNIASSTQATSPKNTTIGNADKVFNQPDRFIPGWYWVLRSAQLKCNQVKAVTILGRDLVVYRAASGKVAIVDAYCPHMGAHLAEGCVDGESLKCFFHGWQFDHDGNCQHVPNLDHGLPVKIKIWPAAEHYGLIWIWTGEEPEQPPPFVPELEKVDCDVALGKAFDYNCHPNVLMINAIDAHHFNTVHNFPIYIVFRKDLLNDRVIMFSNTTKGGNDSWLVRLIQPFYQNEGTYSMCYWYGSTGTVTLGPDFLHFYIMFALRLTDDGKTEGQTVLVTRKRNGVLGWLLNRVILWMTKLVGGYFAKGDRKLFQTIKFDLKTPLKADQSIVQFMQHVDEQKALAYGTWEVVK